MEFLKQRLDKIIDRLTSDELLQNKGLGNEIGFYIFDYPPEFEMEVREHIQFILRQLSKKKPDLKFKHINLFELIINYLKSRNLLDRFIDKQKKEGNDAISKLIDPQKIAEVFVKEAEPQNHDLILISGIGNSYPLLRSHNLLTKLQSPMGNTPLVMFYPGIYSGLYLRLFGKLHEDNYYRAFKLIV